MPLEQQILITAQPGFPSLARKLISDQNDNPPVTVRRVSLLLERMAREGVKEFDLPEVQQLLAVLRRFHQHISMELSVNLITSIRFVKCRLAVHYSFTKILLDRLLFDHQDLPHTKLSSLFAEMVRLKLNTHPLFKVEKNSISNLYAFFYSVQLIRARIMDPSYLPVLDGISLARVAWALSRTYALNDDTAVPLEDALTPDIISRMPQRYLAMVASAFCRSPTDHSGFITFLCYRNPSLLSTKHFSQHFYTRTLPAA